MIQKIDLPFYTRDLLICFYLGKKINKIERCVTQQ